MGGGGQISREVAQDKDSEEVESGLMTEGKSMKEEHWVCTDCEWVLRHATLQRTLPRLASTRQPRLFCILAFLCFNLLHMK